MAPFAAAVFLGAFLLFQVQPLAGKMILPWFGGAAAVWTACMLFFQAVLVGGYAYAHGLTRRPFKTQAAIHVGLLLAAAAACFLAPGDRWKPDPEAAPVPQILLLLAVNVGLPYFALSTTGPLLQAWFAAARPGRSPYWLYALSNAGSLLGLVTFPIFFEPSFSARMLTRIWSFAFLAFALLTAALAWRQRHVAPRAEAADDGSPAPSWQDRALWLALPAAASALLLAATQQMLLDIAAVPLLWVIPLALYLVTFIVAFAQSRWLPAWLLAAGFAAALWPLHAVLRKYTLGTIVEQALAHNGALFFGCLACHGLLARLRPAPQRLTGYFLTMSVGGALGGLLVGVAAPLLFSHHAEYPLALGAVGVLAALGTLRIAARAGRALPAWWLGAGGGAAVAFGLFMAWSHWDDKLPNFAVEFRVWRGRNFYDALETWRRTASDGRPERVSMVHGRIEHGVQLTDPALARTATTYFGPDSGIGIAVARHPRTLAAPGRPRQLRVGTTGLGVGTIAAYCQPGDHFAFYELNPMVKRIAEAPPFSFLSGAPEPVPVYVGDARIVMERQLRAGQPQGFDIMALDAFSGDAVPVHLLTRESFALCLKHLRNPAEGIVAIHISNRYVRLSRVCRALAAAESHAALRIRTERDPARARSASEWVLLTRNQDFLADPIVRAAVQPWEPGDLPLRTPWTDDRCDLLATLDEAAIAKASPGLADALGRLRKFLANW